MSLSCEHEALVLERDQEILKLKQKIRDLEYSVHNLKTKRAYAGDHDLPYGIFETYNTVIRKGKEYTYTMIRACAKDKHGKRRFFIRNFGKCRTREQAVKLATDWQKSMIKNG